MTPKVKKVIFLVAILLLPSFFYLMLYTGEHNYTKLPYIGTSNAVKNESGGFDTLHHKIPYFEFTNQDGKKVTRDDLLGSVYVADFFFTTCPGICPKMTTNMSVVADKFKNDTTVLFLSHSVTPSIDSVAQLKKYALDKNIGKNWHLVTGNKKEIYDLGRQAYFVEENLGEPKGIDDFLHTENFVLIDKNKHIRGIYNGLNKNSVLQLIEDIKTLKKEK